MNPAWSVILFTTLAGAAQGLVATLAVATLAGAALPAGYPRLALAVAFVLAGAGLAASFAHLGRPERAWRAVAMWRTSWLSREVIVLPLFLAAVALWWLAAGADPSPLAGIVLPLLALALAGALWFCTAMIYACLRFVQEWAHPLTLVNFTLIGLASGLVLAGALAALTAAPGLALRLAIPALVATLLAWAARAAALARNAGLRPRSTLQSATGIRTPRLVQRAMGMTGGAFNTREFFHRMPPGALRQMRTAFQLIGFGAPALLLVWAIASRSPGALPVAFVLQFLGLLAERWFFFAEARHPQNLYYQVVG